MGKIEGSDNVKEEIKLPNNNFKQNSLKPPSLASYKDGLSVKNELSKLTHDKFNINNEKKILEDPS